jgi:DNA-binding PadR family transcriptional regulator
MIEYALLSLLRDESDYGYRLKQRFDHALGGTWRLNIGQVYQALQGLERRGFITEVEGESRSDVGTSRSYGRARRLYRATERGVRALERWARRRLPARAPRAMMLLRLLSVEKTARRRPADRRARAACRARFGSFTRALEITRAGAGDDRRAQPRGGSPLKRSCLDRAAARPRHRLRSGAPPRRVQPAEAPGTPSSHNIATMIPTSARPERPARPGYGPGAVGRARRAPPACPRRRRSRAAAARIASCTTTLIAIRASPSDVHRSRCCRRARAAT